MAFLLRNPTNPGAVSAFTHIEPRPLAVDIALAAAFHIPKTPESRVPPPKVVQPRVPTTNTLAPIGDSASGSFVSPRVLKGRLTNLRTRKTQYFMFNPTEISRKDGWEWAAHRIPGASHRVVSGGSGISRMISFTLYFDADRGRSANRSRAGVMGRNGQPITSFADNDQQLNEVANKSTSLDLTKELNVYRNYTYPVKATSDSSNRGPDRAILVYGPLFPSIEVVIHHVEVNVVAMTPQLAPLRATVALELEEFARVSRFAYDPQFLMTDDNGASETGDFNQIQGSDVRTA